MELFEKKIVVLDKGFVFYGDLRLENGWYLLSNAKNIRRYGTDRGLGQLALEGPKKETALDPSPPLRFRESALVYMMDTNPEKWK